MSDDLQSLLDRINREGLERAEAEKKQILDTARAEAARIVEDARTEAERLIEQARRDAENLKERGSEALRQAARDTLLSLRSQLQKRLTNVVRGCVGEAMTAELMADLIREMTAAYAGQGFKVDRLSVLLPAERLETLRGGLLARLEEDLRNRTDLQPQAERHEGFQLIFNGQDVVYDFTDEALAEVLCAYLNAALAELVVAEAAPAA